MNLKSPQFMYIVRIIAGIYLIYLAYKSIQTAINPPSKLVDGVLVQESAVNPVVAGLFGALFVGAGAFFIISSIRKMILMSRQAEAGLEEVDEEDTDEEGDEKPVEEIEEEADTEAEKVEKDTSEDPKVTEKDS